MTNNTFQFQELLAIVATLRGPDGCPWDKAQTHESTKPHLLEEAYEVHQAISDLTATGDPGHLIEELGDLLFQIVLHAQIGEEGGEFTIDDVVDKVCRKMIHRHPHVFKGQAYSSVEEQQADWESLKAEEHGQLTDSAREELLAVPAAFPALIRGQKIAKKAARRHLISGNETDIFRDLFQSVLELGVSSSEDREISSEDLGRSLGRTLFALCRFAQIHGLSAEEALIDEIERNIP